MLLKHAHPLIVVPQARGLCQGFQQPVGFVAQQFRVLLDDAPRGVPRVGADKLLDQGQERSSFVEQTAHGCFEFGKARRVLLLQTGQFGCGLLGYLGHCVFGVVAQRGRQESARGAAQPLGQPLVLPLVAQRGLQHLDQLTRLLPVLIGRGFLSRREEECRLVVAPVEQQRRIHVAGVAAVRAGFVVQRPGADALQQVGALGCVHDQPELRVEVAPAVGAGQGQGFGVRVGHRRRLRKKHHAPVGSTKTCFGYSPDKRASRSAY